MNFWFYVQFWRRSYPNLPRMVLLMLFLFSSIFDIFVAETYNSKFFDEALTSLSTSNDLQIDSVLMVIVNNDWDIDSTSYYSELSSSEFMRQRTISYLYLNKNKAEIIMLTERSEPVLIIMMGGNSTKQYTEIISCTQNSQFEQNLWLFIPDAGVNIKDFNLKLSNELDARGKIRLTSQIYTLEITYEKFRLFEIYKPCNDRDILIDPLCHGTDKNSSGSYDIFIWHRRKNLTGCVIKMVYINSNTFYVRSTKHWNGREREFSIKLGDKNFHGVKRPFLEYLFTVSNFTVKLIHAKDNMYGNLDERTGKWSGIIGALSRNEADMGAQWLAITPARSTAIKYTKPFINVEYKLFMKKPETAPKWNTFLHVFDTLYWMTLIAAIVICTLCLFVVYATPLSTFAEERNMHFIQAIKKSVAVTFRAMITYDVQSIQGIQIRLKRSSQFAVFIICMFGMVNYHIYNGGLIATLMVQNYEMPIRRLEDFLKKPEYKILFKRGGSTEDYFSLSTEDYLQRLWTKIKEDNIFITDIDQAEKDIQRDSKKVLFYPYDIFKYLYESYPCDIIASDESYNEQQWAFGLNNKSTYIKIFNYQISKAMELGLEAYAYQRETECATVKEKTFRPVNYEDIFPAFIFAAIGCVIALGFCVVEFTFSVIKSKK